jgi:uncharacterized protein (TIGR02145 family)
VLYNWYAVDQVSLCPTGWDVPTDAQLTILTDWLGNNGHSSAEGTALKASSGNVPSWDGTDNFGFTALPAGYLGGDGNFYAIGSNNYLWSSSENIGGGFFCLSLTLNSTEANIGVTTPEDGYSIRCLKN